jgi:hypothetical protein
MMGTDLYNAQVRIRELEAALEAACRWLYEPVRPDVAAKTFDYGKAVKEGVLDPKYLADLATIRCALRKNDGSV